MTLAINGLQQGEAKYYLKSAQPRLQPALLTINVKETTSIDSIEISDSVTIKKIYDIGGREITPSQARNGQIVIIITNDGKKRKVIVK